MSVEARYLEPELPDELNLAYRRTFERLRQLFRSRGISPEEAADMAQEAAVRAFLHIRRRGSAGESLDPLIHRIARNMLIDRQRRGGPELVALEQIEPVGDPAQDPTEHVAARQKTDALRDAVGTLPDRHRDAIVYALDGMTSAQIGERLGIGRNAADALLHRARRGLKDRLHTIGETAFGLAVIIRARLHSMRTGSVQPGLNEAGTSVLAGTVGAAAALAVALNIGTPLSAAPAIFVAEVKPAAGVEEIFIGATHQKSTDAPVTVTEVEGASIEVTGPQGPGATVEGPSVTPPGDHEVNPPYNRTIMGVNAEPVCKRTDDAHDEACDVSKVVGQ